MSDKPNPGTQEAIAVSEMVERVAEAAFWAHVAMTDPETLGQWEMVRDEVKDVWRAVALAAIKAMEEPTPAMRRAAIDTARSINRGRDSDHIAAVAFDSQTIYRAMIYRAMISTAIQEKEV